jgi:hypothetical protein
VHHNDNSKRELSRIVETVVMRFTDDERIAEIIATALSAVPADETEIATFDLVEAAKSSAGFCMIAHGYFFDVQKALGHEAAVAGMRFFTDYDDDGMPVVGLTDRNGKRLVSWKLDGDNVREDHAGIIMTLLRNWREIQSASIAGANVEQIKQVFREVHGYRIEGVDPEFIVEDLSACGYDVSSEDVLDLIEEDEGEIMAAVVKAMTEVLVNRIEQKRVTMRFAEVLAARRSLGGHDA